MIDGGMILFLICAVIAVAGALGVVTLRNPMYGALCLLTTFAAVAVLFLLRYAGFVAVVQLFVYGGGIMVLFLFVIMLVRFEDLREVRRYQRSVVVGTLIIAGVVVMLGGVLLTTDFGQVADTAALVQVEGEALGNPQAVAWSLYREFLLPFEIASLFLLVAMIGAVVLAHKE